MAASSSAWRSAPQVTSFARPRVPTQSQVAPWPARAKGVQIPQSQQLPDWIAYYLTCFLGWSGILLSHLRPEPLLEQMTQEPRQEGNLRKGSPSCPPAAATGSIHPRAGKIGNARGHCFQAICIMQSACKSNVEAHTSTGCEKTKVAMGVVTSFRTHMIWQRRMYVLPHAHHASMHSRPTWA